VSLPICDLVATEADLHLDSHFLERVFGNIRRLAGAITRTSSFSESFATF
jgi:hypothetical protein